MILSHPTTSNYQPRTNIEVTRARRRIHCVNTTLGSYVMTFEFRKLSGESRLYETSSGIAVFGSG